MKTPGVTTSRATPCIICEVQLDYFSNKRTIPDYLCSKCFHQWKDHLDEPWMKYLMNQERYRRMKIQRNIQSGRTMEQISIDELAEGGHTIRHDVLREQYDRHKPRRSRQLHNV